MKMGCLDRQRTWTTVGVEFLAQKFGEILSRCALLVGMSTHQLSIGQFENKAVSISNNK